MLLLLLVVAAGFGKDLFVSPLGSGSACSSASPCLIGTAFASLGDGDRVLIHEGYYSNAFPIEIANNITIVGAGRKLSLLDALEESRVFTILGATVQIQSLGFLNGIAQVGGLM